MMSPKTHKRIYINALFSKTKQLEMWCLLTTNRMFYVAFSNNPLLDTYDDLE